MCGHLREGRAFGAFELTFEITQSMVTHWLLDVKDKEGAKMNRVRAILLTVLFLALPLGGLSSNAPQQWSRERANAWYARQPWPVGSNFIPSTAINELEMWQADTFDLPTIDRELGWAEGLGLNTMRVFLHNLAWRQDRTGFLNRMEKFLEVADK